MAIVKHHVIMYNQEGKLTMGVTKHDLENEKRFIELLGYTLTGPDNAYRWRITDSNNNKVGYVQYQKLDNGDDKNGIKPIFGYHTFIDSDNVSCDLRREVNDKYGNIIDNGNIAYVFDIKRDNQEKDHVVMIIGRFPSLTIWSDKYGYITFKIDNDGLYLNFKSKTENFNIEEVLIYKNINNEYQSNKDYTYHLRYCKNNWEISEFNPKHRTSREIKGIQYPNNDNIINIFEKTWVNNNLRTERQNKVYGTIEEMVIKHQMGIDCFSHFRYLINKIIPFNEDVMSVLLNNAIIEKWNLSLFLQENEEKQIKSKK